MPKKKKIVVVPLAGLGNRMRVLSSCIQIAKRDDRALLVAWPVNSDVGCEITNIFKSIGIEYSIPPKWICYILTKVYKLGAIKRFYTFYKILSKLFFGDSIFDDDVRKEDRQLQVNIKDSTLLVASCLSFDKQDFKDFTFTDYLTNLANKEYQRIGENYIGIHIRRTDHVNTVKYCPDKNYLNQIDKCIAENSKQIFFLASDDIETKEYFKQKYKSNIHVLNIKLGREDPEGIYGAIIEMILLSRSHKIICSIISSYSTAAILLGDIKETVFVDTFIEENKTLKKENFLEEFKNL